MILKGFTEYLSEELIEEGASKQKRMVHIEDLPHFHGNEGVTQAADTLDDLHTQLQGKTKATFTGTKAKTFISQHFDGIPIVFGKHPTEKKFFVASDPKNPCFDHSDVAKHHKDDPKLQQRMHTALAHLPKVAPKRGVYQGDLMYDDDNVTRGKGKADHEFTPNAVTYKVKHDSPDGKKITNARLGLVVHTKFDNGMKPTPNVDYENFKDHHEVHVIPHTVKFNPDLYTATHRSQFTNHMTNAAMNFAKMKPESLDTVHHHAEHIDDYVNQAVRAGAAPDVEDYVKYLGNKGNREATKKDKRGPTYQKYANLAQYAQTNKDDLKKAFAVHHDLQQAKNTIIDALHKNRAGWEYKVNNKKMPGPDGYTVHRDGAEPVKLVNRKTSEKVYKEAKKMMRGQGSVKEDQDHMANYEKLKAKRKIYSMIKRRDGGEQKVQAYKDHYNKPAEGENVEGIQKYIEIGRQVKQKENAGK